MDILTTIQGKRIYLDTNIWIYTLEGYPKYRSFLTTLYQTIDTGQLQAITSELTLAEVLVKPFMDQNIAIQQAYQQVLQNSINLEIVPISRQILIEAARLRATTSLKLPDSIHFSTALSMKCDTFLTNDKRIQSFEGLLVLQISHLIE